jgi:hypothetical protein
MFKLMLCDFFGWVSPLPFFLSKVSFILFHTLSIPPPSLFILSSPIFISLFGYHSVKLSCHHNPLCKYFQLLTHTRQHTNNSLPFLSNHIITYLFSIFWFTYLTPSNFTPLALIFSDHTSFYLFLSNPFTLFTFTYPLSQICKSAKLCSRIPFVAS